MVQDKELIIAGRDVGLVTTKDAFRASMSEMPNCKWTSGKIAVQM